MTPIYYRDAKGVILVYDITNPNSFIRVTKWVEELSLYNKEAKMLFVGNKIDTNNWQIKQKECLDYATEHNSHHFFSSAKNGMNIKEIFEYMTEELITQSQKNCNSKTETKIGINKESNQASKSCC